MHLLVMPPSVQEHWDCSVSGASVGWWRDCLEHWCWMVLFLMVKRPQKQPRGANQAIVAANTSPLRTYYDECGLADGNCYSLMAESMIRKDPLGIGLVDIGVGLAHGDSAYLHPVHHCWRHSRQHRHQLIRRTRWMDCCSADDSALCHDDRAVYILPRPQKKSRFPSTQGWTILIRPEDAIRYVQRSQSILCVPCDELSLWHQLVERKTLCITTAIWWI